MKKFLLSITLMLAAIVGVQAQRVSLDFTTNDSWGFPVGSSNKAVETATFTSGDYSIELTGSSGNGYYFNSDGYLMLGKSGATLTLPAFDFNVSKIEVVGRTGASTSTLENVYVGSTAVSTQCKGSAATNTFEIASEHQAAGTVYTIKIESKHNAQFTQINIYSADEPVAPSVSTPVASVAAGVYTAAQSVTFESEYANAENPTISYYYTTDGSEPTKESTVLEGALEVTESCTVKVIAVMTVGEEEYTSKAASYEYIISEAAKFVAVTAAEQVVAGKVLLVANNLAAHGVSGNYGYLPVHNVTAVEGGIENAVYYGAFELEVAEGGWYIKDNNGKYIYMTGTYNSFNVSEEVPAEGAVWTIAIAEDGTATITNVAMNKYVQYSTKYTSYGAYAEAQDGGVVPTLYVPYVEPEVPFEVVAVTPAEAVTELSTITVEFSEEIAGTQDVMAMETIYVGNRQNACNFTVEGKVLTITLWTPITAAGEYALYIPEGVGITRASNGEAVVIDGEITFTVEEPAVEVTANAISLAFTRTGTNGESVSVVAVNENGETLENVSVAVATTVDFRPTAGSITEAILCPNVNGNAGADIEMTFTLSNLPEGFSFNNVGLDIHALNGGNGYQQNNDNKKRQWNVAVAANDAAFGSLTDIDIASGIGESGVSVHKVWTVEGAAVESAENSVVIKLNVTSGTLNEGCFFGLSEIQLTTVEVVEPEVPFEVVAVTPAEAVTELSTITVEFSEEIAGEQDIMDTMNYIYVGSARNACNFTVEGKVLTITLWTPITTPGEYALKVPAGVGITRASNGEAVVIDGEITFTVEEAVVEPEPFDWAGTYVFTGEPTSKDGSEYPAEFEVVVEFVEANAETGQEEMYLVTSFMGNDVNAINYGGIELTIAEDGKSATLANGNVHSLGGGSFLKIFDANGAANPIAITLNEDGTLTMADFTVVMGAWGSNENNTLMAEYKNNTLVKGELPEPEPETFALTADLYPAVEGDITEIRNIRVQHGEGASISELPTTWTLTNEAGDSYEISLDWGLINFDDIFVAATPAITEAGTYTLTIPAGSLTTDNGKVCEAATFSWTVVGPVDPYMPYNNGTRTNTERVIKGITLTGASGVNSYALTENEQTQDYTDATAVAVFKVAAGEELTITFDKTGEWIHQYVFIDYDGDGFTASIEAGSSYAPAEDLVAYSFYNNNDGSDALGWNSVGDMITDNNRSTPAVPAFNAPTEVGTYRMRVKQDWCNIDPAGDADGKFGDFKANGGQIIDVILEVVEATTGIENVEAETVKAIYDITGRKIEKITEGGIYIVNGKKVLVK